MQVLAAKLRAVMPEESPIDLDRHAEDIARTVFEARRAAVGVTRMRRGHG